MTWCEQPKPVKRKRPEVKAYDKVTDTLASIKLVDYELGYIQLSKHSAPWEMRSFDDIEFLQYTGIYDAFGDPIYEADVVQDTDYRRYRVCYGKHPEKGYTPNTFYLRDIDTDDIKKLKGSNYEIIGYWYDDEFFEN